MKAAAEAYDAILDEQLDLVGAELLIRRARCHFALGRWLQAAADAGRAAKVAAEADDDEVNFDRGNNERHWARGGGSNLPHAFGNRERGCMVMRQPGMKMVQSLLLLLLLSAAGGVSLLVFQTNECSSSEKCLSLHYSLFFYVLFWIPLATCLSAWQAARERAQALELRGRCYIHLGDFELAGNHFRQV